MNKAALWSLIGSVLIVVMLVVMVPRMLSQPAEKGRQLEDSAATTSVAKRPACPATEVAGVSLPCLGAVSSEESSAKPTVVNVWAWWCGPCREELPLFDELAKKHPELNVIGVHADRNAANGAAMLTDLGIELASYQDNSNSFAGNLSLPGVVPITVLVREDGTVAKKLPKTFHSVEELETAIGEVEW